MSESFFKTIVVGVDFSPYSRTVARQAVKLAEHYKAKLVFVHALDSAIYSSSYYTFGDFFIDLINPMREEVQSFYKLKNYGDVKVVVEMGAPSDIITRAATKAENPMIVIGHKGQSALGRFFLGSNAERLALTSPYPVWVHRGNTVKLPERILLPCDFSSRATESFTLAKELVNGGRSSFEFFHAEQMPLPILDASNYKAALKKFRAHEHTKKKEMKESFPGVPFKTVVGDPAPTIAKESKKFDLIAMAPRNKKSIFSSFGSVTAKVIRSGDVPVIIAHGSV